MSDAPETTPPADFTAALAAMRAAMHAHPFWRRAEGTPLENDLPVIAAKLALDWLAALRPTAAEVEVRVGGAYEMPDGRSFWVDAPVAREIAHRAIGGAGYVE